MDPISGQVFSHDYPKFVFQDPDVRVNPAAHPPKPFDLNAPKKASKSKKDLGKQKKQHER